MKITFYGQACFLIETSTHRIMIDPWLKGNPLFKGTLEDIPVLDFVLVTHAHGDHLGDAVELAKRDHALVVTNFELGQILRFKEGDLKLHTMHIGGSHRFAFGLVKMTPALHGSGYIEAGHVYDGGLACGYYLELDGYKIYHAGDTGLSMEMSFLAKRAIDYALLPIGGNYTMDTTDAIEAINLIKPKYVIPMHFNTFPLIQADPEDLQLNTVGAKIVLLKVGESKNL